MIKKRYIFIPLIVLLIGVIALGAIGYILFLRHAHADEVVFPATEVGTPQGEKVTKNIGPEGGTIKSPDGRLTLIIPQNAVEEINSFSIQPITNKALDGLGLGYRLEPNGRTFSIPLQIAVHYDDQDLGGTIPAALTIGYQDEKGAWHAERTAKLYEASKTVTVSATHFSDWAFLSQLQLSPAKATLHPGENQVIVLVQCRDRTFLGKLFSRPQVCELTSWANDDVWTIIGPGTYESSGPGTAIYTAPGKKPTPNIAHVLYPYEFELWDEAKGSWIDVKGDLSCEITIIDQGYEVSGQDGPMVYSGVICDLEKKFAITVTHPLITFQAEFTPSSSSQGTAKFAAKYGLTGTGSGPYEVGNNPDDIMIVWHVGTALGPGGGNGDAHIFLTPLGPGSDKCTGK